jgi:hypothetical protein
MTQPTALGLLPGVADTYAPVLSYAEGQRQLGEPASNTAAIAPSNSSPLQYVTRALWIGGAGSLAIVDASGNSTTFVGVPAGVMLPIRCQQVRSTGTSCSGIVGLW